MRDWVAEWQQEGRLFVWRYANPRRAALGWHFTADAAGCRSIRNLLDRMKGGSACYRTLRLDPVTDEVLRWPNLGRKCDGRFARLRLEYRPDATDLSLRPDDERLVMMVGNRRLRSLCSAFSQVEAGRGDFAIAISDNRKVHRWMFWWMQDNMS